MRENKIIFTGPVGVGKTTAIAAISDEALVQTDASASDMTLDRKRNTTVVMDYGPSAWMRIPKSIYIVRPVRNGSTLCGKS